MESEKRTAVRVHPWTVLKLTDPAAYVSVMRENAAKRSSVSNLRSRNRQQRPQQRQKSDASPQRAESSHLNDLQSALIKNVL